MRRLLLVSSSRVRGGGLFDDCAADVTEHFRGAPRVLFVPWALGDRDGYARTIGERFARLGLVVDSVHATDDPREAVERAEGLFIGGGNTFRLLNCLHEHRLIEPIRRRVLAGMPYMGSSAGSNVASPTIRTTNDMPIVYPPTFDALALVPFQINPHYLDPDPHSTHMGETREQRIREFHEENEAPVVGLREGARIVVEGPRATLRGGPGARLFRKGEAATELADGGDLSFLLA